MNRMCKWMCASLLAVMLIVMMLAAFDRAEAQKPELTLWSFLDGSWFENRQRYYAENFPSGDLMEQAYGRLEDFYHPSREKTEK